MKQTIVNTRKTFLFIEVQDDAYDFTKEGKRGDMLWYKTLPKPELQDDTRIHSWLHEINAEEYLIISTTKNITEEQAEVVVENNLHLTNDAFSYFKEYDKQSLTTYPYETAKESLESLLKANNLDTNKNYLILEKIWRDQK